MKSPVKNFDPYRPPSHPTPLRYVGNLARRIKTRALRAVGQLTRRAVVAVVFWPLWLAIDCAILASACDEGRLERVTMPRQDATTHAAQGDGAAHE